MNRPGDLVAIPPLARTVIYYVLALALVVVTALTAHGIIGVLWLEIVGGVSGVFFGVAGSNVPAKPAGPVLVPDTEASVLEPLPSERVGYGSGV